MPNNGEHRQM